MLCVLVNGRPIPMKLRLGRKGALVQRVAIWVAADGKYEIVLPAGLFAGIHDPNGTLITIEKGGQYAAFLDPDVPITTKPYRVMRLADLTRESSDPAVPPPTTPEIIVQDEVSAVEMAAEMEAKC